VGINGNKAALRAQNHGRRRNARNYFRNYFIRKITVCSLLVHIIESW